MTVKEFMEIKDTKKLIKYLLSIGYTCYENGSSHQIYRSKNKPSLSVPNKKEISRGVLRNLAKLLYGNMYYESK